MAESSASQRSGAGATSDPILNRVVVVLTPLFALLAGSIAAWVGEHIPGVQLDQAQLTALIVAVVSAALTMAVKWLHGWQRYEAHKLDAAAPALSSIASDRDARVSQLRQQ